MTYTTVNYTTVNDTTVNDDRDYWQNLADILKLKLYGWNYRNSASFFYGKENKVISLDLELAEHLEKVVRENN